MKFEELLAGIVRKGGMVGLKKVEKAMDALASESKEPWKRAVVGLLGDAVEKYGLEGIKKVEEVVNQIARGESPVIDFANLKARSDFLAVMENMEADQKSKAKDFFATIGQNLGVILKALIAALASA